MERARSGGCGASFEHACWPSRACGAVLCAARPAAGTEPPSAGSRPDNVHWSGLAVDKARGKARAQPSLPHSHLIHQQLATLGLHSSRGGACQVAAAAHAAATTAAQAADFPLKFAGLTCPWARHCAKMPAPTAEPAARVALGRAWRTSFESLDTGKYKDAAEDSNQDLPQVRPPQREGKTKCAGWNPLLLSGIPRLYAARSDAHCMPWTRCHARPGPCGHPQHP